MPDKTRSLVADVKETVNSHDVTCLTSPELSSYPGYFREPHWISMGLLEISRVTWQLCTVQYIPRNMHTVFALLCFVVVIHWLVFPYPSGLLHWHCGNLTIAPVPAKQPWWIWINTSREFIMNDCITTTKQSTTKPCAYFLGYTVCPTKYTHFWCAVFCCGCSIIISWSMWFICQCSPCLLHWEWDNRMIMIRVYSNATEVMVNFTNTFFLVHFDGYIILLSSRNGRHFADDIFKCIFLNENFFILTKFHWNMYLMV